MPEIDVLAEVGALASLYSARPATLQSLSGWLCRRVTLPGRFLLLRPLKYVLRWLWVLLCVPCILVHVSRPSLNDLCMPRVYIIHCGGICMSP